MQGKEEFSPLEFISTTSPDGLMRSPRRSPRFKIENESSIANLHKRLSLPFAEMRKNERRNSGVALHDRAATVEQTMMQGRIRRNSIIWPAKEDPQIDADRQLSQALNNWKLMRQQIEPNANIEKIILDTLLLLEKYYIQGIVQFCDPDKPGELGLSYSLLSILESMYKCPAVRATLQTNYSMRAQFCSINFIVRDYRSILGEASLLLKLVKKHQNILNNVITYFSKKQVEALEEFAFVPFVRGIAPNSTPQEIFKVGMIKDKDIPPFYQRLGMRKFVGLDADVAKVKMVDIILNPQTLHIVYGHITVPTKTVISKEALEPLKNIVETLHRLESSLDMFTDNEFELKINLTINPMGKIKERIQLVLEDLISRLIGELSSQEQGHYHVLVGKILPSAQVGRKKNWSKAFELLHELATKVKL